MQTSSTIDTHKTAFNSSKMGNHYFSSDLLFLYIYKKPNISSLRWNAAYKNLLSGFKVIVSLTTQSQQKFCKKRDTNFIATV